MPTLIRNIGQLVTLAGDNAAPRRREAMCELGIVERGAVLIDAAGLIAYAGPKDGLPQELQGVVGQVSVPVQDSALQTSILGQAQRPVPPEPRVIDAGGRCVTPGLVDSHTHLCFAGDRAAEFYRRCGGVSYAEIARAGGGILRTVAATRQASEDELVDLGWRRAWQLLYNGTTTVEVKSGYGLTPADELKQLRAIRRLEEITTQKFLSTYMGAHSIPPEFAADRAGYVRQVVETIPQVAAEGLAEFVDIFVDPLAFSHAEAEPIVEAARAAGLALKLHGDEFGDDGTAAWGAQLGAVSIDHLGGIGDAGIAELAASDTVATLLPGTMLFSGHGRYAPARRMIDAGCAVALATDLNPGSSHVYSLPLVMTLAALQMGMTAAECLTACTINAAHALGAADRLGSLEPGKRGDLVLWDCASYEQIPYFAGTNLAEIVLIGGR